MRANVCQRLANDILNMFCLLYESLMDCEKSFDRKFYAHIQGKHRKKRTDENGTGFELVTNNVPITIEVFNNLIPCVFHVQLID